MKTTKVRKGKKSLPTQVHVPKNKRADKFKDEIYNDWFEQQIEELPDGEELVKSINKLTYS